MSHLCAAFLTTPPTSAPLASRRLCDRLWWPAGRKSWDGTKKVNYTSLEGKQKSIRKCKWSGSVGHRCCSFKAFPMLRPPKAHQLLRTTEDPTHCAARYFHIASTTMQGGGRSTLQPLSRLAWFLCTSEKKILIYIQVNLLFILFSPFSLIFVLQGSTVWGKGNSWKRPPFWSYGNLASTKVSGIIDPIKHVIKSLSRHLEHSKKVYIIIWHQNQKAKSVYTQVHTYIMFLCTPPSLSQFLSPSPRLVPWRAYEPPAVALLRHLGNGSWSKNPPLRGQPKRYQSSTLSRKCGVIFQVGLMFT